MTTGDIELGRTNAVAPQVNGKGAVVDIEDDENRINDNDSIEKGEDAEDIQGNQVEKLENTTENNKIQHNDNDVKDDENEQTPLSYCRFVVERHRLAFGMFICFIIHIA